MHSGIHMAIYYPQWYMYMYGTWMTLVLEIQIYYLLMYMYMVWMCLCAESLTSCAIGTVTYMAT